MADLLRRALHREGYSVIVAKDGQQALDMSRLGSCDVMLLDIMLPHVDGFTVIKKLRAEKQNIPIIVVSARDAMSDIVSGLDLGADDYLTKPFVLNVLLARIRAVTRRNPVASPVNLQFHDLILSSGTHQLHRGSRTATLTRTEYALLETLLRRAGYIVPHDKLIEAGWGLDSDVSESTLYVFMRSLRTKITQGDEPQILHTSRGVGYTLRLPPA
jgi:DNA-binding response OmpR family regulator